MDKFPSTDVKRDAPAAAAGAAPGQRARRAGKILLAEGNRLCLKIALRILQIESHQVTVVTNCEQVLAALPQRTFDLILMDAELPEMTGFEATGIIRENEAATGGHIPIVAMTSSAMQGDNCLRAGMDQYLAKPLNLDELRRVVAPLLPPAQIEPAFDQAAALSRMSGDRAFLCTLALMFVEGSPSLMAEIRAAVEQQDGARLARAAHKLKGAAYPLCATAVTDAAQILESIGESGRLAAAMDEYLEFQAEIGRLLTALGALLRRADDQRNLNFSTVSAPERTIPCTA